MKVSQFLTRTLFLSSTLFFVTVFIKAETYSWNGGSGDWSDESKWSPNGRPGASDTASIDSGTVIVSQDESVGTLNLSTATIGGTGTLTIATGGTITTSTQRGGGTTIVGNNANVTFADGDHTLFERTLNILGTMTQTGTGSFLLSTATINVGEGAVLNLASDALWKYNGSGIPTITISGTLRKSSGTGESMIDLHSNAVSSTGVIEAVTGTLKIVQGVSGGGTYHAESDGHILIQKQSSLEDVAITGTGLVEFQFGWGGLSLTGNCASTCALINGTTVGGVHTLQGTWRFDGATFRLGTTTIAAGSTMILEGSRYQTLSEHNLENYGTICHEGSGNMRLGGTTIENRASGLIDIKSDADWPYSGGPQPAINNAGTLRKSGGTDVSYFDFPFGHLKVNNTGTIEALSGTFDFWQGLNGGGIVHAGPMGTVLLKGGSNLTDVQFTGPGIKSAPSGELYLSGKCYAEYFELEGATLAGVQTLSGIWNWHRGSFGRRDWMTDDGSTTLAEDCWLRILSESEHVIEKRTVINHGIIEHVGTGPVNIWKRSFFTNSDSGIIILESVSEWLDRGSAGIATQAVFSGTVMQANSSDIPFTFFSIENTAAIINDDSWTEDPEHGWLWLTGIGSGGFYSYDWATQAWSWIHLYHYPDNYRFGDLNAWTRHVEGTATPDRWCYVYGDTPGWLIETAW